ncbi:hypothetical protein V8C86DRAFT_3209371 [Haematococcus lacustris]
MEDYIELYSALTKSGDKVATFDARGEACFTAKDLAQVLALHGLGDGRSGSRKKREVLASMQGMQLIPPLPVWVPPPVSSPAAQQSSQQTADRQSRITSFFNGKAAAPAHPSPGPPPTSQLYSTRLLDSCLAHGGEELEGSLPLQLAAGSHQQGTGLPGGPRPGMPLAELLTMPALVLTRTCRPAEPPPDQDQDQELAAATHDDACTAADASLECDPGGLVTPGAHDPHSLDHSPAPPQHLGPPPSSSPLPSPSCMPVSDPQPPHPPSSPPAPSGSPSAGQQQAAPVGRGRGLGPAAVRQLPAGRSGGRLAGRQSRPAQKQLQLQPQPQQMPGHAPQAAVQPGQQPQVLPQVFAEGQLLTDAAARLGWLAHEVVRFSQEAAVVASEEELPPHQLVSRRIGFLLLQPMEHKDRSGAVEGVLQPGVHQGAVARRIAPQPHITRCLGSLAGSSCQPELCDPGCRGGHEFCLVRVLTQLHPPGLFLSSKPVCFIPHHGQGLQPPAPPAGPQGAGLMRQRVGGLAQGGLAQQLRRPGTRLELMLDLAPALRLPQLAGLLGLVHDVQALGDAWMLLRPSGTPSLPEPPHIKQEETAPRQLKQGGRGDNKRLG